MRSRKREELVKKDVYKKYLKDGVNSLSTKELLELLEILYALGKNYEVIEVADTLKGEMVVVCSGYIEDSNKYLNVDPIKQVDELIVAGIIKNEAIKMVAKRLGITKQELYKEYSEKKNN